MSKICSLLIGVLLVAAIVSNSCCESRIREYSTAYGLEKKTSVKLPHPPVMGVTDLGLWSVNNCGGTDAIYAFEVNGRLYCLIAQNYGNFMNCISENNLYDDNKRIKTAVWNTHNVRYTLSVIGGTTIDRMTFEEIAQEMKMLTYEDNN